MTNASPFRRSRSLTSPLRGAQRIGTLIVGLARRAGFWSAIVLPFVLLALVITGAITVTLVGALVVANLVALRLGHRHGRE